MAPGGLTSLLVVNVFRRIFRPTHLLGQVEGGCTKIHRGLVPWISYQYVILDHNQRLAEGGPIVVIHHIQCCVIDFGWVGYEVMDGAHFFIVIIRFDPSIPRREPNCNCAVNKCLNCGCWSGELVWRKQFTVGISKVHQMCMDLLKQPLRRASTHRCVDA